VKDATPALTPAQQRVVDELMAAGQPRPAFSPTLPIELRHELEQGVAPLAERLPPGEVFVNKHALARVHACEAHYLTEREQGFSGWSVSTARGTVAHKAVEICLFATDPPPPLELVDAAMTRFKDDLDDRRGVGAWLRDASAVERAEVRSAANGHLVRFLESFPPLPTRWRPRVEVPARVDLCGGRVVLRSKADLLLGMPRGREARVLIVDFKTGAPYATHVDDLRFYALLEAIRTGVPPFRVASYYLDSGTFLSEDVDLDVLHAAVARTVAGVSTILELHLPDREPSTTPGSTCSYCPRRVSCDDARLWEQTHRA
jgi:hypothetical protein